MVAFDNKRNRMGMGKGYYDKFLTKYNECFKIGIAFEEQRINEVPTEAHDISLDMIVTENNIYF